MVFQTPSIPSFSFERHNGPFVLEGKASEGLASGQAQPPLFSVKKAKNMNNYLLFYYFVNIEKVLFLVIDNQLSRMELCTEKVTHLHFIRVLTQRTMKKDNINKGS